MRADALAAQCAEVAATCACLNFRQASRAVTQLFDTVLHPTGLRSTQFVILVGIAMHDARPIAQLARELVIDRTTLTRNLKPLVAQRLVKTPLSKNRRMRLVTLTDAGRKRVADSLPLWKNVQSRIVAAFGEKDWQRLVQQVSKVVATARTA